MKVVSEKNVGKEVEVQFELDEDEYKKMYKQYLKEKELKEDSENYTFEDYFQELIDVIMLEMECNILEQELKEQEKMLKFKKDELQARIDANNS